MNGNVDEEGIRLDLEWMARIGVGGAQVFEGGMNTPQVVTERLVFGTPAWDRALRTAAQTADRLGLELTVATSAGWSAAGAPWVAPEDAMKKVVWSETLVDGGREVAVELPSLPATAGRYQDVPRWGRPPGDPVFCRDTVVLAIPAGTALPRPVEAWADGTAVDPTGLTDGVFADGVVLPRELRNHSTTTVTTRYASPVTVAAVTVGLPGPRGFGSPPPVHAVLGEQPRRSALDSDRRPAGHLLTSAIAQLLPRHRAVVPGATRRGLGERVGATDGYGRAASPASAASPRDPRDPVRPARRGPRQRRRGEGRVRGGPRRPRPRGSSRGRDPPRPGHRCDRARAGRGC
jgi:hypothetical protein